VFAIGHPKGFANTLSDGLVSGHREIDGVSVIQITAPISPGSSGGPLLATDGKVVGVTSFKWKGGENLNFAAPASQVARLLLRCEKQAKVTAFPLEQQLVAESQKPTPPPDATMPNVGEEWPAEDLRNAAHFVRAIQAANNAWELCRKAGQSAYRPWLLGSRDRAEFAKLIVQANVEAKLVRRDILKRMHPMLPTAFDDFILATSHMDDIAISGKPDGRVTAVWNRFTQWWGLNASKVRIPEGAKS
jgi:hypothetical protein